MSYPKTKTGLIVARNGPLWAHSSERLLSVVLKTGLNCLFG